MSPTLFWYVFKDLVKTFLMASGVIAGIMSFGGLLKPLAEHGLDFKQVAEMLGYFMPAMTTYSYPIAALFATTIVYGRLSADNEVTGMRAAGISMGPLGLGLPALVGGFIVSMASLTLLSFVVPAFTLKVEKTIFSNLGQLIANRIEQDHQIKLPQVGAQPITIFARRASVHPMDPDAPNEQRVTLEGVSIVTYSHDGADKRVQIPEEFYMSEKATATIRQPADEDDTEQPVMLSAILQNGNKFPRQILGHKESAMQGGVRTQQFGPIPMQSVIRENTKFMDIRRLHFLTEHPEKSIRISEVLTSFVRDDQQFESLLKLKNQYDSIGTIAFATTTGEQFTIVSSNAHVTLDHDKLRLILLSPPQAKETIQMIQQRKDAPSLTTLAREARIRVFPDNEEKTLAVSMEMTDAIVTVNNESAPHESFERSFVVPMDEQTQQITQRTARYYLTRPVNELLPDQRDDAIKLRRSLMKQNNSVVSEIHSRISFAISCLVLVMVGYGLGVMFKSGNYLTAFAVSVAPALLSIVLIVTGQHICENVPPDIGINFHDPLNTGLAVIWSGNAIVLMLAVGLLWKLRRI